ncbi:hypothetical protein ACFW2V_03010 [Streptomyces sp. NPDC058947]|uniref:hypothetical protein n=1 Tax=Streptomyces sp. NPDC058947 TaxID=3346675 RepID=UPI0036C2F0C5
MTSVALCGIKVDSTPQDLGLSPHLVLRLAPGVHLDLADASEATLREMARLCLQAARVQANRQLPEVA